MKFANECSAGAYPYFHGIKQLGKILPGGGGTLSNTGLLGMCHSMGRIFTVLLTIMGSCFQAFSAHRVTQMGSHDFMTENKKITCPKVTKMGSIIGHKIDYSGVGVLRCQWHIPSKTSPKYPPPLSPRIILLPQVRMLVHGRVNYWNTGTVRTVRPKCLYLQHTEFLSLGSNPGVRTCITFTIRNIWQSVNEW